MIESSELKICVHLSVYLCLDSMIATSTSCLPLSLGFCVFIHGFLQLSIKWSVKSLFVIINQYRLVFKSDARDLTAHSGNIEEREHGDGWTWRVREEEEEKMATPLGEAWGYLQTWAIQEEEQIWGRDKDLDFRQAVGHLPCWNDDQSIKKSARAQEEGSG